MHKKIERKGQNNFQDFETPSPAATATARPNRRAFSKNPQPMLGQQIKEQAPALYKAMQAEAHEEGYIGETNRNGCNVSRR